MFDSFVDYLAFQVKMRPEASFGSDADQKLTYAQAWHKLGRVAASLQARGINKDDRVAILAKNSLDNLLIFLGCARAGVVPVGINYRLTADEVGFIAENADARLLFVDAEFSPLIGSYLAGIEQIAIVGDVDGAPSLNDWLVETAEPAPVHIQGVNHCANVSRAWFSRRLNGNLLRLRSGFTSRLRSGGHDRYHG